MIILGIETSCDETSAALVKDGQEVLSNVVSSSSNLFENLGGVVPEVASRAQLEYILPVINKLIKDIKLSDIDAIAVTCGPGLNGSLLVGINTAKSLAYSWKKPLMIVNHLEGHLYANWLNSNWSSVIDHLKKSNNKIPSFPCLHLLVSGGHTMLILQKSHKNFEVVGETLDDSAGEAFDKIGVLLGLTYPAGPKLSKLAETGNIKAFDFPRAMINNPNIDFSFSGLKTAVRIKLNELQINESTNLQIKKDLAASFEEAVVDVLVKKSLKAVGMFKPKSFALSGGVSANSKLRKRIMLEIGSIIGEKNIFVPQLQYTGDNAAMIAAAAYYNQNIVNPLKLDADPNLYL